MAEMVVDGVCPDCRTKLAIKLGSGVTTLMPESTVMNLMDDDGNGFWCQTCEKYVEPDDITVTKE